MGDLVRMDYIGPDDDDMDWDTSYVGVIVNKSGHYGQKETGIWKILVTDSDGAGIGSFTCDYWRGTVIK